MGLYYSNEIDCFCLQVRVRPDDRLLANARYMIVKPKFISSLCSMLFISCNSAMYQVSVSDRLVKTGIGASLTFILAALCRYLLQIIYI